MGTNYELLVKEVDDEISYALLSFVVEIAENYDIEELKSELSQIVGTNDLMYNLDDNKVTFTTLLDLNNLAYATKDLLALDVVSNLVIKSIKEQINKNKDANSCNFIK